MTITERDEHGAMSTEKAIIIVTFFSGFLLLVMFAGRVSQAENDVRSAAHEAARAATLEATPAAATSTAARVARANLSTNGVTCVGGGTVSTDTSNFGPDGWVAVSVNCRVSYADVTRLRVPGSTTFSARATEIIDQYRSAVASG
jgi:Flp pilus assembly protein TadG